MKRPISVRLALAWAVAALPGCWGDLKPCANLEKGGRLQVEILGAHDELDAGEKLCSQDWGLGEGAIIDGTVADFRGDEECKAGVLDAPGVGDWKWALDSENHSIGMKTLESFYSVSRGACQAEANMELTGPDSSTCTPNAGETCKLFVRFQPRVEPASVCPPRCSTDLDVHLRRL